MGTVLSPLYLHARVGKRPLTPFCDRGIIGEGWKAAVVGDEQYWRGFPAVLLEISLDRSAPGGPPAPGSLDGVRFLHQDAAGRRVRM